MNDVKNIFNQLSNSNFDFALLLSNPKSHNCKVDNDFILAIDSFPKEEITELENNWQNRWLFGYVEYEENLPPRLKSHFFSPDLLFFSQNKATEFLSQTGLSTKSIDTSTSINLICETSKKEFIERVTQIKEHIRLGDIYELNYCVKYSAKDVLLSPALVFSKLNKLSKAPYSVFARIGDNYILSASPERFIKKVGKIIQIEPMKGTARRVKGNSANLKAIRTLQNSEKERAENIMIVDLSRNDLSRICITGTVKVDEYCKIFSFKNVHQMVSVISGKLKRDYCLKEIFEATFPMGSMTGAPKHKAMELISRYEDFSREMYSGSFGYLKPNGDFDFNVLIRSIFYNHKKKNLSFATGGAITINSDPEKEWEELLLKAETLKASLNIK